LPACKRVNCCKPAAGNLLQRPRIGVLAIQGDFAAHAQALVEAGADAVEVRTPAQLEGLDGLILPGGESTTFLKFLERDGLLESLQRFVEQKPAFGTCAGCILLARNVSQPAQPSLAVMDISVERNAYGRQIDSAIQTGETKLPGGPLEMVYIRAPRKETVSRSWCGRANCWRPPSTPNSRAIAAFTNSSSTWSEGYREVPRGLKRVCEYWKRNRRSLHSASLRS
jgi:pyridoxal 5'-phosphate synthase glutaminase subunit Pdx2